MLNKVNFAIVINLELEHSIETGSDIKICAP